MIIARGLRAHLLPSAHWLEWSDFWLCHEAERNVLLPRDAESELGALRGALLLGEAHAQAHPGDVAPAALRLHPAPAPGDDGAAARRARAAQSAPWA
jgi:hypothetical protein